MELYSAHIDKAQPLPLNTEVEKVDIADFKTSGSVANTILFEVRMYHCLIITDTGKIVNI